MNSMILIDFSHSISKPSHQQKRLCPQGCCDTLETLLPWPRCPTDFDQDIHLGTRGSVKDSQKGAVPGFKIMATFR